jgi:hypothetical protein
MDTDRAPLGAWKRFVEVSRQPSGYAPASQRGAERNGATPAVRRHAVEVRG